MSKAGGRKSSTNSKAPKEEQNKASFSESVEVLNRNLPKGPVLALEDSSSEDSQTAFGSTKKPVLQRKYGEMDETPKSAMKRKYEDEIEETEMNNMIGMFSSDMAKSVNAKRKRVAGFTTSTIRANEKIVVEPWKAQLGSTVEIAKQLHQLSSAVLEQVDVDIAMMKGNDEKMIKLFQQQMKNNETLRSTMQQRVAACRQINDNFMKKVQEQDAEHHKEVSTVQQDLKKELYALQKKMLNDSQKEEMDNVRKNLTQMLLMSSSS